MASPVRHIGAPTVTTKRKTSGLKEFESEALANYCNRIYKFSEDWRRPLYETWFEMLAMLQDDHYTQYRQDLGYYTPQKAFGQETYRAVVNLMLGAHQNLIAKILKARPTTTVVPTGGDTARINEARHMNQINDHLEKHLEREQVRMQILGWTYACGIGISKSFWDPFKGENIAAKQISDLSDEDYGRGYEEFAQTETPVFKRLNRGDIAFEARGPFEVAWDPMQVGPWFSKWIYEHQAWHIDEAKEWFPETWKNINPESTDVEFGSPESYRIRLLRTVSNLAGSSQDTSSFGSTNQMKDHATIVEMNFEPNQIWPEGAMVHFTPHAKGGERILSSQTCPNYIEEPETGRKRIYAWHGYNFYADVQTPGKAYPRASLESCKSPQRMLNRNVSSIQEFNNLAAKYRIISRKGAQVSRDTFNDYHMDFVEVNGDPASDFKPMPVPQLSSTVTEQRNYLMNVFDILIGQTLEEEGKAVRSNLSGDAIEHLDALQQQRMIPKMICFLRGLVGDSRLHLLMAKQYYPMDPLEDRTVVIVGANGRHRMREFDSELIDLDFAIDVAPASELTRSVAAKKAEAHKMYASGALGDPADPKTTRKLMKLSEFGHIADVYEEDNLQESLTADRLDAILDNAEGVDDGPWHFEDHELAIDEINKFKFRYYGKLHPLQRMRVDYMAAQHADFAARKEIGAMGQQQDAAMLGGEPIASPATAGADGGGTVGESGASSEGPEEADDTRNDVTQMGAQDSMQANDLM